VTSIDSAAVPAWAQQLADAAADAGENVQRGLVLAEQHGRLLPFPGEGATAQRWVALAAVAEQDLTAARILEAHTDALAILREAEAADPDGTWGVFAAEAPGTSLTAEHGAEITLSGVKPWCSLAGYLDHALVTAHHNGERGLYAVSLKHPSVTVEPPERWVARGLRNVTSAAIHLDGTPAEPVGGAGWYLRRPGFAWGGMGVAACWYGGARALYRTLRERTNGASDIMALHVGVADVALHAAAATLTAAAEAIDAGDADGRAGAILALRVRSVVADAAERVVQQVGHALGPAPLAFDERHARRVSDLELYVRQHHAERDLASLGTELTGTDQP
jgi:alkylation response protein AidB-like acyl-CoA dehydrogenase